MVHKFNPKSKNKLDNEWRRENLPPKETLLSLGLTQEDNMADIGCGIGYFTIAGAQMVKNQVFALDTSVEMLEEVKGRIIDAGLSNITTLKTDEYDLKLPGESITFALLVNVLHEIADHGRMIDEIHRILKPGGRIAVIEWVKTDMEMGPPKKIRIEKEELDTMFISKDFELVGSKEFAAVFYGKVFKRKT